MDSQYIWIENNGLQSIDLNEIENFMRTNNITDQQTFPSISLTKLNSTERTIFFILYIIIFSLSIFGNIATLFTTYQRKSRLVQKVLIILLAISDILICISIGVNNMINFSHPMIDWVLGKFMCSFVPYMQQLVILTNSIVMALIAMDRYRCIVQSENQQWNPNIWICILLSIGIWVFSAGITFPMFLINTLIPINVIIIDESSTMISDEIYKVYLCLSIDKNYHILFYSIIFFLIFIPLMALFLWLYYQIAILVWRRRKPLNAKPLNNGNNSVTIETSTDSKISVSVIKKSPITSSVNKQMKFAAKQNKLKVEQKIRTFKIIIIIMGVFFICRMPHYILNMIRYSTPRTSNVDWIIANVFSLLIILNTTLNPFLYSFLNSTIMYFDKFFRSIGEFISHVCCCCCFNVEFEDFETNNPFSMEQYEQRPHKTSSIHPTNMNGRKEPNHVKFQQGLPTVSVYPKEFSSSSQNYMNCKTF